jgi:hypothetical protein
MADIYKSAVRRAARKSGFFFNIPGIQGKVGITDLYNLNVHQLTAALQQLNGMIQPEDTLDFIEKPKETTQAQLDDKLRFDVLKDIYLTRVAEAEASDKAQETKAHNQMVLKLIAEKEAEEFKSKSVDELKALLKK